MPAERIDGTAIAAAIRAEVAQGVAALAPRGVVPGLAVVLVGEDPASTVYVRAKEKASVEAGMAGRTIRLPATTSQPDLLAVIDGLNADPAVHGILVQMPLPRPLDGQRVVEAIAFDKDVDGLHATNAGLTLMGQPHFRSCTPYGVMKMLESIGVNPAGKHAVVIGRSNMVGKPMAMLLLAAHATVTICHSATPDLGALLRQADIVVAAAGRRGLVTAEMIKPGAVVIDVGTNKTPEGKLAGDVDFVGVSRVAGWISPVPGGVGPMTITMLLVNTVEAAERAAT